MKGHFDFPRGIDPLSGGKAAPETTTMTQATTHAPSENPSPFGLPNGHPDYEENFSNARHKGGYVCQTECCCYCGRKAMSAKRYAFLTAMSEFTTADSVDPDCDDFLGFYPLGTDCASKLRKLGVPVYKTPAKYGHPDFAPTLMAAPKKKKS